MIHPWNRDLFQRLSADRERLPHALLLQGPRGVGKFDLAMELARWVLCEQPGEQGACGVCGACHWFEQGNHPDFRRVEPLENEAEEGEGAAPAKAARKGGRVIQVAQVREVTDFLGLSSHRGGWRAAVFHPAELMHTAAANALLKTLEEPPPRVLLILVSHQAGRLLPTVISRCRRIDLAVPSRQQALDWLRPQGLDHAETALDEAGGAPLLAVHYAGADYAERREAFIDLLANPERLDVCAAAESYKANHAEVWQWLVRWVHDLNLQRLSGGSRYFPQRAGDLTRLAQRADLARLLALQRLLGGAARSLRHPLNPALLLESWLLSYGQLFGGGR